MDQNKRCFWKWIQKSIFLSFLDLLDDMYDEIENVMELDDEIWYSEKSYRADKRAEYLIDWIPDRLEYCDDYFNFTG